MGVDHIIFAYNFMPIGRDIDKMIDITKQLLSTLGKIVLLLAYTVKM